MAGETNLSNLIKGMKPILNEGEYVFVTTDNPYRVNRADMIGEFKEAEGTTVILKKEQADKLNLSYDFVASWITLTVHSSLEAVGLTALFSTELAKEGISCNVVAGYYHDHIFVGVEDQQKAMNILNNLSESND